MALLLRIDARFDYLTDLLPALLVFSVGLSMTVAPLTAAVLSGVEERHAGVASGVNNAVARVAELLSIAASPAVTDASVRAFHVGMGIGGSLVALGGIAAGLGLRSPRRRVPPRDCPGGALVGHPQDEPSCRPPALRPAPEAPGST